MKGKKLLPIITLALISLVACNNQAASNSGNQSKSAPEASESSQAASESSEAASNSSQSDVHVHDMEAVAHDKGTGEVAMDVKKCKEDAYYEASWSATDSAVVTTQTSTSTQAGYKNGKFGAVGDTAEFKIWVPVAMNARLYATAKYNKDNIKGVDTSEHHTVWFDWRDDHNGFKVKVTVNGSEINQANQTVNVNGQEVSLKDLNFNQIPGYNKSNDEVLEFPWVNVQLNEGQNTIKLERTHGYGHTYEKFTFKANI